LMPRTMRARMPAGSGASGAVALSDIDISLPHICSVTAPARAP
jgi:hypothetical protein